MASTQRIVDHACKKPSVTRFFGIAAILLSPAAANGQGTVLSEADVVARALTRAPLLETLAGHQKASQGRMLSASAYPNPELSYVREQTFGTSGTGEDRLSIAQTIDLGNRRGLAREAGEALARSVRSEGEAERVRIASDARMSFYELLYRQSRVVSLERWREHIEEALAIVARRERSGDAATYDLRRLERERAVAAGRIESEHAALERAQARIRALLGEDSNHAMPAIAGTLLPDTDPPDLPRLRASTQARPDLRALDQRVEAAAHARTAGSRGWIPQLTLQGGWKGVDFAGPGRSDGFVAGASLSIPVWDHASGLAQAADGEAQAARGRRALLENEITAELGGARAEVVRLRRAAIDFEARSNAASTEVVRIASAGYAGGELGLLELLDAYRGAADDAVTALDMAHAARRARLELDLMTATGLP